MSATSTAASTRVSGRSRFLRDSHCGILVYTHCPSHLLTADVEYSLYMLYTVFNLLYLCTRHCGVLRNAVYILYMLYTTWILYYAYWAQALSARSLKAQACHRLLALKEESAAPDLLRCTHCRVPYTVIHCTLLYTVHSCILYAAVYCTLMYTVRSRILE